MLIAVDKTDRTLSALGAAAPRFDFADPPFAEVVVQQIDAEQYAMAHFRVIWHLVDRDKLHANAERIWQMKRPWFCSFV